MNIDEILFSQDRKQDNWLHRCLPTEPWQDGYEEVKAIIEKAKTGVEVVDMILNSDTLKGTQIYAELSKNRAGHRERVMRDLESWNECWSDAGGLKIGSAGMSIVVPNGRGDGPMYWTEVDKNCLNSEMLKFWTSVSGTEINVYDYDCSEGNIAKTLNGRYGIYSGYGLVVFERWGDAE